MFTWKILDVFSEDGQITKVRYQVTHENVSTEGYWVFRENRQHCELSEVHEHLLTHWLHLDMAETKDKIQENLEKQAAKTETSGLPWKVETFKVKL
jgi:hypothetical protein